MRREPRPAVGRPVDRDLRRLGHPVYRRPAGDEPGGGLDTRGRERLDVAKTIYYRRRKWDPGPPRGGRRRITGRDVQRGRVVPSARSHSTPARSADRPDPGAVDPAAPPIPPVVEGTRGTYSRTPIGGFADLRSHTARPTRTVHSTSSRTPPIYGAARNREAGTTSRISACSSGGCRVSRSLPRRRSPTAPRRLFTFDPSGATCSCSHRVRASRFLRRSLGFAGQMARAGRGCDGLWRSDPDQLYPTAFWVGLGGGVSPAIQPRRPNDTSGARAVQLCRDAAAGRDPHARIISASCPRSARAASTSGSGHRSSSRRHHAGEGGSGLATALGGLTADTTIKIADRMTYRGPTAPLTLPANTSVVLRAHRQRLVVRWTAPGRRPGRSAGAPATRS